MKKTLNIRQGWILALGFLVLFAPRLHAQLTVKEGKKNKVVATQEWVKEYVQAELKKTTPTTPTTPTPTPPVLVDKRPDCKEGLKLITANYLTGQVEFTFHSLDVQSIDYTVRSTGMTMKGNTGQLTSSRVTFPATLQPGNYTLQIKATNCKSDSVSGVKPFIVAAVIKPPIIPVNPDKTGGNTLIRIKDPLLPQTELTGNYEIRYIESKTDNHLDLRISYKDGQIYLTDVGNSLQSASYTLNGWTDLANCSKLSDEPIRAYRLYHLLKFSVARPTIQESWMAEWFQPKADYRRSELFFYVVPTQETWNPVGESPNPIGRPAVFARLPKFELKSRTYGFEYDILDETNQRKEELSISFNWKEKHDKLYSPVLSQFLRSLPAKPDGSFRAFHDLTKQECIDFANRLQIQKIMAFDIEPDQDSQWIIDYDHPNFNTNMGYVIERLEQRGAKAYNWMEVPGRSVKNLTLDNTVLGPHGGYGHQHKDLPKYKEAYSRIGDLKRRENPGSIISTGFGYIGYDNNFSVSDGNGQNISPQLTYLKSLDASELWSRAMPDKQQVYFSWAFTEFDFYRFPQNHVVEIPEYGSRAIRTDNKPLYPPDYFQDNLTLSFLTSKYLFYWSPGPLGWNPANTTTNSRQHAGVDRNGNPNFSVWNIEKGNPPLQKKFYAGKEAMAINATVNAAYTFSQIQDAADGTRTGPKFRYGRATKDGQVLSMVNVDAITDGSWYIDALMKRQPFAVYLKNGDNKVLLVQDVWSRPGRFTDFEVEIDGTIYAGQTEGNRLFVAKL